MTGTKQVWAAAALGVALVWCAPARAQVWTGGGPNPNWSTATNWANGTVPVSGVDTSVTFAGNRNLSPNQDLANPFVLNSLVFNGFGSSPFTLTGNGLDFRTSSGGVLPSLINADSSRSPTLNLPITVTNNLLIALRASPSAQGAGYVFINGPVSGGGGLTVGDVAAGLGTGSSPPVVGLASVSSYTGPTVVNQGTFSITGSALGSSSFTVNGGGILQLVASNPIGNVPVALNAGSIFQAGGSVRTYGDLVLGPGASLVYANTSSAGPSVLASTGTIVRAPGALVTFGGGSSSNPVGSAPPGPNIGNITFATPPALVGGGGPAGSTTVSILPYAYTFNVFTGTYNAATSLVTYGPNGVRELTAAEYATSITPGTVTANNVIATSSITGIDAPTTINALRMSPPIPSAPISITGAGTLTVTSGAVIGTGTLGVANLAFGSREAIFRGGSATLVVDSTITGTGGLTANGSVLLRGANQFTGNVYVIGGGTALFFTQDAALGAATNPVTLGGAALVYSGNGPAATARPITLLRGADVGLQYDPQVSAVAGQRLTLTGPITGSGPLAIGGSISSLAGAVELTNTASSYTGATIIQSGTLRIPSDAVLGAAGGSLILSGGTLQPTAGLTFTRPIQLGSGAIDTNGFDSTVTSVITGGALTKAGTGTLTLAAANTYTGGTIVSGGALAITSDANLGATGSSGSGVQLSGGTLRTLSGLTSDRRLTITGTGAIDTNGQAVTWTGPINSGSLAGNGTLVKAGAGTLTLTNPANGMATVAINGGALAVGPSNTNALGQSLSFGGGTLLATGPFTLGLPLTFPGNGTVDTNGANVTLTGPISGPGGLTKVGAGDLALAGQSSYTGLTTVAAGRLLVSGTNNLNGGFVAANGGTLRIDGGTLNLTSGSLLQAQAGGTIEYNNATVNGGFLRGPGTHTPLGGTTFNGTTLQQGATMAQNVPTTLNNFTNGGIFTNGTGIALAWDGGGNSLSGQMTVNGTANLANWSSAGVTTINPGGTVNNSGSSLVLGGGSRTFLGTPANRGGALNLGSQTLELNGGLLVNNGTITGTTNVNYGGLAKGAGTYGPVNVGDGGRFSPGNSPGTVTTGDATWGAGGQYLFEMDDAGGAAGVNWDLWQMQRLAVGAGTTANSRFTVALSTLTTSGQPGPAANFHTTQRYDWLIARAANGVTGFAPSLFAIDTSGFANPTGGGTFGLVLEDDDEIHLTFTPVPEPGSLALTGLAAGAWALLRRRRRPADGPACRPSVS